MFGRLKCWLHGTHEWTLGPTGSVGGWWALTGKDRGWGGYTMYRTCKHCGHREYGA